MKGHGRNQGERRKGDENQREDGVTEHGSVFTHECDTASAASNHCNAHFPGLQTLLKKS